MKIEDARAAVIGMVQNFRPNADFPVPNSLLDFLLFQKASEAMKASRMVLPANWMYSRFACQTAQVETSACGSNWKVDLPFVPLDIHDAIGLVTLKDPVVSARPVRLRQVPYNALPLQSGMVDPPQRDHPAFTLMGDTIYLLGRKSFEECGVSVSAVVGALNRGYECSTDINVAIPEGGGSTVIEAVAQSVIAYMTGKPEDNIEDNESDQRESTVI